MDFSPQGVYKGLLNVPSVEVNNLQETEDNYAEETASKVHFSQSNAGISQKSFTISKPPKHTFSNTNTSKALIKQGLGGDMCPFCSDAINKEDSSPYELTVNQIIKMYEYFESKPAGLLLIPGSCAREQKLFEDVYA